MRARTEEFLYFLLWTADTVLNPTWSNLTDSFEMWASRRGLMGQLMELERRKFLERFPGESVERISRITEQGRLHAMGGRDPLVHWARRWDRRWGLVIFDVPTKHNSLRCRLRRHLRSRHFGYLQNSVWITPDPVDEHRELLAGRDINVESLVVMEATPRGGESDRQIAAGAWDFLEINRAYSNYLEFLEAHPALETRGGRRGWNLPRWVHGEREAWLSAVHRDPLLPECLLPRDYLGRKAWERRLKALRNVRETLGRPKA